MTSTIACLMMIAIAGTIGYLFYRQQRIFNELGDFYKENNHVFRKESPVEKPFVYSDAFLTCTDGRITPNIPYTLILGTRSSGGGQSRVTHRYIAFYIPATPEFTDEWLSGWKQKVAERGDNWAEHSGIEKMDKSWGLMSPPESLPIRAVRINDSILLAWIGLHTRQNIETHLEEVKASLQIAK